MEPLVIKHIASGLFSECSVRLNYIVNYFNQFKKIPENLCSKHQFLFYQDQPGIDVAKLLFLQRDDLVPSYNNHVDYSHEKQFSYYKYLELDNLRPLIEKYFTPIPEVHLRELALTEKYSLDFSNTIGVIYRGNDKVTETTIAPYEFFFYKAEEILNENPGMRFLVQTDELEFREEFCLRFPNSVYFEELPPIRRNPHSVIRPPAENRIGFAIELLAAVRCLAQTEYLITASGNLNIWTVIYRGHGKNISQYLSDRFLP